VRSGVQQARHHHAVEGRPEHDDSVVQQRALGRDDGEQGQHAGAVRHQAGVGVGDGLPTTRLPLHEPAESRVPVVIYY